MNKPLTGPNRFHSLDVLRGVAALCVVFWHWQHFLFMGTHLPESFVTERQPLFTAFSFLYKHGWLAVDLFFSLSGFIFYWLYSQAIHEQQVSAREFALLRFSRLYPLHLVTLLWVAGAQLLHLRLTGSFFVYPLNDAYHFALNLFFISNWGFEAGKSFNGPIWSVSVEVALYGLFFVLCRTLAVRFIVPLLVAGLGLLIVFGEHRYLGRGLLSFFIGGCTFLVFQWTTRQRGTALLRRVLCVVTLALWIATVALATLRPDWWPAISTRTSYLFAACSLFPLTILSLALVETHRGTFGSRVSIIGDISYSSYLLHFPLQLSIVTLMSWWGVSRDIFYSTWSLAAFFAVLILVSFLSFHYLERPMQRLLRSRLSTRPAMPDLPPAAATVSRQSDAR